MYAFSQLTAELSKRHYQRINSKLVYRQETTINAAAALEWADYPITDRLVDRLMTDTSPLDPTPTESAARSKGVRVRGTSPRGG